MIQPYYCKEKSNAGHSYGSNVQREVLKSFHCNLGSFYIFYFLSCPKKKCEGTIFN